jgi:DNA polymerase III alpha subunit
MKQNKFGQLIFSESDLCDLFLKGHALDELKNLVVDQEIDLDQTKSLIQDQPVLDSWKYPENNNIKEQDFHRQQQSQWHMPDHYKNLDIAAHVLSLCKSEAELQRCGTELLLYQERDLFDLLRYLKYLVDVMKTNNIVWGVGRGSSVASYVLYLLGVHRIDSMYYDLDPQEFLR